MTARRFFFLFLSLALALFGSGCALLPDRWTVEERETRDPRDGRRWDHNEVDVSVSGPIPPLVPRHE